MQTQTAPLGARYTCLSSPHARPAEFGAYIKRKLQEGVRVVYINKDVNLHGFHVVKTGEKGMVLSVADKNTAEVKWARSKKRAKSTATHVPFCYLEILPTKSQTRALNRR